MSNLILFFWLLIILWLPPLISTAQTITGSAAFILVFVILVIFPTLATFLITSSVLILGQNKLSPRFIKLITRIRNVGLYFFLIIFVVYIMIAYLLPDTI